MTADRVRVGVLISGRGSNMVALAEYRRKDPGRSYDIALVVSNDPAARGLVVAKRLGIKTWAHSHKGMPREDFDMLVDDQLRAHDIEVVALAGYMRLLSPGFIAGWQGRILNIHPSLLPLHKGTDTHRKALLAGDLEHGCSIHVVTEELDGGPVLAQARMRIAARDDPDTLAAKVLIEEHRLYPETLDLFCEHIRRGR